MFANCCKALSGTMAAAGIAFVATVGTAVVPVFAQMPAHPHQRSQASLTSTERFEYRITQNGEEKGTEAVEKRVFNNNTVEFTIEGTMLYGPGIVLTQHIEMSLEEESFFPRTVRIVKTVTQPDSTSFKHMVDVDMVSNVAVVTSMLNGQGDSRRFVVPTGTPVGDVGVLGYFYPILFWYDRSVGGSQQYEWLDPLSAAINHGEIKMEGAETIPVMGKKKQVSVFNLEREKIGAAKLWVDPDGAIVRCEQNFFVFELVKRKKS